jgi:Zn-dependent protease with chaperone function
MYVFRSMDGLKRDFIIFAGLLFGFGFIIVNLLIFIAAYLNGNNTIILGLGDAVLMNLVIVLLVLLIAFMVFCIFLSYELVKARLQEEIVRRKVLAFQKSESSSQQQQFACSCNQSPKQP